MAIKTDIKKDVDDQVLVMDKIKKFKGNKFKVIFHNDDKTPFDFVIGVLTQIFNLPKAQAENKAQEVHNNGSAIIGLYTKEIAMTKVDITLATAREYGFPLKCTAEKE